MACDQSSLKALELLMDEFFGNETTNERKHEIEIILSNFGQQQSSWKQCLYYLAQTHNSYVSMFCLTTLENILNKRWAGLESDGKSEIRSTLYRFVLENHKTTPTYIRNKLVKLVVDIARLSWPHFYPEFFTNVLSMAQNQDTVTLCIIFLQTISEELVSSRAELSYTRKVELKRLLMLQVPSILSILTGFLENIIEKHKNGGTTTPPPSPTQGNHSPSPARSGLGGDMSLNGSLVNSMFETLRKGTPCKASERCLSLPRLDPESESVAALCLKCLTHLFSWIPLSTLVTPTLLNAIFVFASLGTDPQHNKNGVNCYSSASNSELSLISSNSVSVLAMSAVNEILSKNCIPLHLEDFLLQTFNNTFHLLQKLVYSEQGNSRQLEALDPEYLDKFSDFLHLIVSLHLRRFEDKEQFPILEFLSLLYRYTFLQPNVDAYFSCLEVWSIFLDHLTAKICSEDQTFIVKYEDALIALAKGILQKFQFCLNQSELEELEHDLSEDQCGLDDDDADSLFGDMIASGSVTEWQAFLSNNVEVVAKVADLYPDRIFALLFQPFNDIAKVYLSLQSNISPKLNESGKRSLNISSEHECKTVHCLLRDLSTFMQGIGRLSILFLGENLSKRSSMAMQVISKLLEITNYSTAMKWFEVETAVPILRQDLIEVHAQALSTLRAWTHWLSQLYGQQFVNVFPGGTQAHQFEGTCHTINKQMLLAATNVLNCGAPHLIVNCAIQLLSSLSVLVRSPVALDLPSIQSLYNQASSRSLELKVQNGLSRSLVNFLLLPWPSFIPDHKLELRKQHLAAFLLTLTKDFCSIDSSSISGNKTLQENNMNRIIETVTLIRAQMDELNGADKSSREVYYQCMRHFLEHAIAIFPAYVNHSEVCDEILSLFVVGIQVLRHQMGVSRVTSYVQTFLDIFTANHHLYLAVSESQPIAVKVIERFLKLLELITCEPGHSFQRFVPNTIMLCMDNIYPSVADKTAPEVKGPLFKVLHCLVDRNWKYFFKSSVQSSLGNNPWDLCEHEAQFVQIMQAFGQSFMQTDITIFKQNLSALESLNSKYKLYHKAVFRTSMLGQFITVLLQILVHKSHDLLQEEIALTIYNMAAVDFEGFFCAFLTHFLQQTDGLTEDQKIALKENFKAETDLPSFTQNNQRFVNDLRFYRICNDSLPQGTVKF